VRLVIEGPRIPNRTKTEALLMKKYCKCLGITSRRIFHNVHDQSVRTNVLCVMGHSYSKNI